MSVLTLPYPLVQPHTFSPQNIGANFGLVFNIFHSNSLERATLKQTFGGGTCIHLPLVGVFTTFICDFVILLKMCKFNIIVYHVFVFYFDIMLFIISVNITNSDDISRRYIS